jgi:hypothetical protein
MDAVQSRVVTLVAFVLVALHVPKAQDSVKQSATSETVCGIVANPERYDGKLVRISAVFVTGFEFTVLRDSKRGCIDIWVAKSDTNDAGLQRLAKYATARLRNKKHPLDTSVPRYALEAIFIGKIQHTHESGFTVDRNNRVGGIKGRFGHLGQYNTQVFLTSVTDFHPKDLFGTVYKADEYQPAE